MRKVFETETPNQVLKDMVPTLMASLEDGNEMALKVLEALLSLKEEEQKKGGGKDPKAQTKAADPNKKESKVQSVFKFVGNYINSNPIKGKFSEQVKQLADKVVEDAAGEVKKPTISKQSALDKAFAKAKKKK